ncbi:unnamed protein product [Adineta steineri]|uniref:Alpha/beta hydrolase domain-containing protein n=1 Tax=Adineta steineri TaxID=433720 RepID=A0A818SBA9_9BILA|nr:unnamed protein product [Adineta steineri]CAF3667077.1 unnamed protein product [Adineta steineri]
MNGITRIVMNSFDHPITPSERPAVDGNFFNNIGAYKKLRGIVYGQLDPTSVHNSIITDLYLALCNRNGMIEYLMDFYSLKPINQSRGNHKIFFEVNNRGQKLFNKFAQVLGGNKPTTANDVKQAYTIVWSGWNPSITSTGDPNLLRIYLPIAKNIDSTSITDPVYQYIVFDNPTSTSYMNSYDTNSIDTRTGFAATRYFVSFLRSKRYDNPLAEDITRVISWNLSQPARYMNDFLWLGFNQDTQEKQVFDGIFNWIGAGNGIGLNYRFAQLKRTECNRQNHLYPEATFPFTYTILHDPLTGKIDGRNARSGSLMHSNLRDNDPSDLSSVRYYLISGTRHSDPSQPNTREICQQFGRTIDPNPILRALFVALDQ